MGRLASVWGWRLGRCACVSRLVRRYRRGRRWRRGSTAVRVALLAMRVRRTYGAKFGKETDQFRALYAYSPYHHVVDGTQYPAVLFLTGDNDPRVDPANSRKMTARLQASGTKRPILLRTSSSSGHGMGTALSERIAEDADVFAFLFDQLGVR